MLKKNNLQKMPSFFFRERKRMDSLTLRRHNSFQNVNYRKAAHSFVPIPLIFKWQQQVSKFNDICVS